MNFSINPCKEEKERGNEFSVCPYNNSFHFNFLFSHLVIILSTYGEVFLRIL